MTAKQKPPLVTRCRKVDAARDFECVYSNGHPGRCCMQRRSDIVAGEYLGWLHHWKKLGKHASADNEETGA